MVYTERSTRTYHGRKAMVYHLEERPEVLLDAHVQGLSVVVNCFSRAGADAKEALYFLRSPTMAACCGTGVSHITHTDYHCCCCNETRFPKECEGGRTDASLEATQNYSKKSRSSKHINLCVCTFAAGRECPSGALRVP